VLETPAGRCQPVEEVDVADRTCTIQGCNSPRLARGWCSKHYQRWKKHGHPDIVIEIQGDDWTRFWSKVSGSDALGCWEWEDAVDKNGYGIFRLGRHSKRAHRVAWEFIRGPIPTHEGIPLVIDHECRNPPCVNPWHLDPVTAGVNSRRGVAARPNACIRGHARTPETTRVNKAGSRYCLICVRDASRRRGRPQPPKVRPTHCRRGHQLVEPNLLASMVKDGLYRCRACRLAQSNAKRARSLGLAFDLELAAQDAYDRVMRGIDGRTARTGELTDQRLRRRRSA
jgi:hypothetical protein